MNKQQYKILIGIDPGTHTGFAVYSREEKKLLQLETVGITKAMELIKSDIYIKQLCLNQVFVRVEDARLRKWFGGSDREKLQGAGSIKRDCSIWQEFLTRNCIPFEFIPPKNNKTKIDASVFTKVTGWTARSSPHARDAAMLVYGF